MAAIFCWFAVILVFACAVLRFMRRKTLACWLLFIFPAALSTVRQGQSPMGGSNLGNTMTNAVVQSLTDDLLTVTSADQS